MKNKKGALELSINAVVVIIIAIVMLGLALTFIRSIFGGVIEQFETVSEEVQKQMEETLRASTKKAALSTTSLDMKPGDSKKIYLGINNYLSDSVDFCIAGENFKHGNEWCSTSQCDGVQKPMTCTSYDPESDCGSISISGPIIKTVLRGKIDVIPLTVKIASNAASDTYLIPIHVCGTFGESTIEEVIDLYVNVG